MRQRDYMRLHEIATALAIVAVVLYAIFEGAR